jgi:LacI family transcriptional regulator
MGTQRARLKDIAESTGFSVNTVSLALRASRRIPASTTATILSAAERLNYVPNRVARSLASRTSTTVGLVLTDIMNPTLTLTARDIERRLAQRGYSMMLAASDNDVGREKYAIETMRSHQVDGLLVYPAHHLDIGHIRKLRATGYPVVLLGGERAKGVDIVAIDDRRGAFKAVDHLARLGHRRIAFFDPAGPMGNREKLEGYLEALRQNGIKTAATLVADPHGHDSRSGYQAMGRAMARRSRPTALFAATDNLAIGALAWCRDNGVRVPDDLSIVGYDDTTAAAFAQSPLTTINYDTRSVGELAIERLFGITEAPGAFAPKVNLIEPALVVRTSCGGVRA